MSVHVHFVIEGGELFSRRYLENLPEIGDELRFSSSTFFKVTRRVWVYDEDLRNERLNIGMVAIK